MTQRQFNFIAAVVVATIIALAVTDALGYWDDSEAATPVEHLELCERVDTDRGPLPWGIGVTAPADTGDEETVRVIAQLDRPVDVVVDVEELDDADCGDREFMPQVQPCETIVAVWWSTEFSDDRLHLRAGSPVDFAFEDGGRAYVWVIGMVGSIPAGLLDCTPAPPATVPELGAFMLCEPVFGVSSDGYPLDVAEISAFTTVAHWQTLSTENGVRDIEVMVIDPRLPLTFVWTSLPEVQRAVAACPMAG